MTKLERNVVPHGGLAAARTDARPALLVAESVFGMDGSAVPPAAYAAAMRPGDVLLVDEAHALGVAGEHGSGLAPALRDERVVVIGTLSKALGASGGFVAGPADVIELLVNTARTFIFDTAMPAAIASAAACALQIVRSAEGDALRVQVHARASRVRDELRACGYDVRGDDGPIVPVVLGSEVAALQLARVLEERGIYAPAIRPPTVPPGTSRLRIVVRADHSDADIDLLLRAFRELRARDLVASE